MKRLLLALLVMLLPTQGFAQATVLQGGSWTAGILPTYSSSGGGSQPIIQQSGPAAGTGVGIKELSIIARGTGTAPYAGQGTGQLGTIVQIQDAPSTNAAGYHALSFSANAQGGGLIAYNALGGASNLPLQFNVNGTTYEFPFAIGGIVGPPSSTVGNLACWNNSSGTLLSDCGIPSPVRPATSGTRTYYIRTDGNDTNCTGLTDAAYSSGSYPQNCAFVTWQKGVDIVRGFDLFNRDIYLRAGEEGSAKTWNLSAPIQVYSLIGFGTLRFLPSSSGTTINGANGGALRLDDTLQNIYMGAITLTSSGPFNYGTVIVNGKSTYLHETAGPTYGVSNGADIWVHDNQALALILNSTYRISGSKVYHFMAANGGHVFHEVNNVTITTGITIDAFAAAHGGTVQATGSTFTNPGNVTGSKYNVTNNGYIDTLGNGANYFPGTTAGTYQSGGVYTDIYPTDPRQFPGGISSTGNVQIDKANPIFSLLKAASGQTNTISGTTAGVNRWLIVPGDATAEGGANAGSDFSIVAMADNGSTIGNAILITRSDRKVAFGTIYGGAAFTIATLPTCNAASRGMHGYVTDGTAPTFLGAVGATGVVIAPVWCNGSAWLYGG